MYVYTDPLDVHVFKATSVPPAVTLACTHTQGTDTTNVYVNKSTAFSVGSAPLDVTFKGSSSWKITNTDGTIENKSGNFTKLFTTVGTRTISASIPVEKAGVAGLGRCSMTIPVKLDPGTNTEI